jgi:hypothetical protein
VRLIGVDARPGNAGPCGSTGAFRRAGHVRTRICIGSGVDYKAALPGVTIRRRASVGRRHLKGCVTYASILDGVDVADCVRNGVRRRGEGIRNRRIAVRRIRGIRHAEGCLG